jgi:dextranase
MPVDPVYIDPLDRELSLSVIADFISSAQTLGMASMPYLAVYAASLDFWRDHQDWGLFDEKGQPLQFGDFLGLMDPSAGSPWQAHLLAECDRILDGLPFDGFHVDQYGDPKMAYDHRGEAVDLPTAFQLFISNLKSKYPDKAVTFNAVGNWPIEELATSDYDFNYIEVWSDTPCYEDLQRIVSGALLLSESKPVVIALYQPPEDSANILLSSAIIFSSGGTRILLGENERLLADPYFPNHNQIPTELQDALRSYHDFCVRYGEWLGPWVKQKARVKVDLPLGVWCIPRETPGWLILNLINTAGVGRHRWDRHHLPPERIENIQISILAELSINSVWWSSPDNDDLSLEKIPWYLEDNTLRIEIPNLFYWSLLAIELNG